MREARETNYSGEFKHGSLNLHIFAGVLFVDSLFEFQVGDSVIG